MRQWLLLMMGVGILSLNVLSEDQEPVRVMKVKVLKNNVNMRAKSNMTSEVVGQVSENDELVVKSMDTEWVEIVPPAVVDLWLLSDYVSDGLVNGEKVNVRAGPGINFSIVGQLNRGTNVTVRESHAQWLSIAPPETCSLWVYGSMVEVIPDEEEGQMDKGEPVKAELVTDESMETEQETEVESPDAVASLAEKKELPAETAITISDTKPSPGLDLMPSPGQGQRKQVEGVLRPRTQFFRVPSKYRLVIYDKDGNAITVCYVKGNNAQLKALLNRRMVISGREYWVRKARYPVLVPERIVLKGK